MTKKIVISIYIISAITILGILVFKYEQNCVKRAIMPIYARMLSDNKEYFIIKNYGSDKGGGLYYIDDGEVPVVLIGRTPDAELAWPISGDDSKNRFLVKGHVDYELSDLINIQVIDVEEWEIIAPILRCYEQEDDNKRIFYPLLHIDKYDKETNVYFDVYTSLKAVDYYEKEKLLRLYGEMYEVTSAYVGEDLQWYLKEDDDKIPIQLCGNNPRDHFNNIVLSYENNDFLIKGTYFPEQSIIVSEEWFLEYPIARIGLDTFYESKYYFEKREIEEGVYTP